MMLNRAWPSPARPRWSTQTRCASGPRCWSRRADRSSAWADTPPLRDTAATIPHIYESSRGQRPVGAANYGLEKIDAGKIQIRQILTTRQGVGSSPIDGQVFRGTAIHRLTGRRPVGHRSALQLSQVFSSVAPTLVLPP